MLPLRLFVLLSVLTGCSANLRQVPAAPVARNPSPACARPLYLGRLEISGGHERAYAHNLKRSLAYFIAARRSFRVEGELRERPEELKDNHLILDADIRLDYEDSYNWWVTWPAVYPMVAYWPVQHRTGKVNIVLSATVSNSHGRQLTRFERKRSAATTVHFYGFFRTRPMEDLVRSTLEEVFRDAAHNLSEHALTICTVDAGGSNEVGR